jgi:hypothetical protein
MKLKDRTFTYVTTLDHNSVKGKKLLKTLRKAIKGSIFRLSLMGRGPRKHLRNTYQPKRGLWICAGPTIRKVPDSRFTLQSFLPLEFSKKVDVYVRVKDYSRRPLSYTQRNNMVACVSNHLRTICVLP